MFNFFQLNKDVELGALIKKICHMSSQRKEEKNDFVYFFLRIKFSDILEDGFAQRIKKVFSLELRN